MLHETQMQQNGKRCRAGLRMLDTMWQVLEEAACVVRRL